jgi:hypothetical protein
LFHPHFYPIRTPLYTLLNKEDQDKKLNANPRAITGKITEKKSKDCSGRITKKEETS